MSVSAPRPGVSFAWLAALVVVYYAMPGHQGLVTRGLPLGFEGTAIVAAVIVLGIAFRSVRIEPRAFIAYGGAIMLLIIARVALGSMSTPHGWTASYFANEQWAGPPEWSSEFRRADATRLDRVVSFKNDTFPAFYLNDLKFNRGDRRDSTEPMTAEWRGFTWLDVPGTVRLTVRTRGVASVLVDGQTMARASSPTDFAASEAHVPLAAGFHELAIRYLKPPDTDGLIEVQAVDSGASAAAPRALEVTPLRIDPSWSDRLLPIARAVGILLLCVFALASAQAARLLWRRGASTTGASLTLALCTLFGIQGWRQAITFAGRVQSFNAGDDWWGFEACARDILRHGLLLNSGKPLGQGEPYFYHPLYCYFLALVHGLTGESLAGPVLVQFLILAAVAAIMWRFAGELFGTFPASVGLAALLLLFELDFTRYYTPTLLSENLYVLTVTLAIVPFVRWVRDGAPADLVTMAFWGGVSTITRPPMLLYLFPALVLVAFVSWRRSRRGAAAAVAIVGAIWLATVAPVTLRNVAVSGRFVLVSDVQSSSVLTYNIPPTVSAAEYGARFRGTFGSALNVVGQIGREHPLALLAFEGRKIGFSLGMIHWAGGYRPHPELIAVTALYLVLCVASAGMRSRQLWPVHLFVLVHLCSLLLTMPWNYGYRMVLQPYVYTTTLSVAALTAWIGSGRFGLGRSAPIVARA